jgi:hypothetical protein
MPKGHSERTVNDIPAPSIAGVFSMTAAASPRLIQTDWKTLYRAAILEPDRSVIRQKVSEAESAVLARARELFYSGGRGEEKELLEDALYLLRAYQNAWDHAETEITSRAATAT